MGGPFEHALLVNYLVVGAALFGLGLIGFLARRNMIVMFICVEMMLQGVSINLVAWSRYWNDFGGQVLTLFIITIAACEAAIALALVLTLARSSGNLDIAVWHRLREANQPPFEDVEISLEPEQPPAWPKLTPAGVRPTRTEDERYYESHV